MAYTALIPVKSLARGKSRLRSVLSEQERKTFVLEMLGHVISVLQKNRIDDVIVVSPDELVLEKSLHWGATAMHEKAAGHNQALTVAAQGIQTTALLTISADLPLLRVDDIEHLLSLVPRHDVVIAAAHDQSGTNAIVVRPPLRIPYRFGMESLQKYTSLCEKEHLRFYVCHRPGMAFDIDTKDDLQKYRSMIAQYKQT